MPEDPLTYFYMEENELMERKLNTIQQRANLNDVYALGEAGPGGAFHKYSISSVQEPAEVVGIINFQKGPRKDPTSESGVLDTDLLEIVRDRLTSFQAGPFACSENEQALDAVTRALFWMNKRVEDRLKREVLGTNEK